MYHSTVSHRAKVIEEAVAKRRKERLRKEREEIIQSLEWEKSYNSLLEGDKIWNAAIDRAIEIVEESLR
jgi:predicted amino acid dehydrogenase